MTTLLLLILYIQFVNEYIFQLPRIPFLTYIITILIFCYVFLLFLQKINKKIDKLMVAYFLCLPLVLINESFLASVNIFGFALYLRSKKNISIDKIGKYLFFINLAVIVILFIRIHKDSELVRVIGKKLDRELVVHGFNNPNTEAEFYYFCALGAWLGIKNKILRNLLVIAITIIAYQLTFGRTYMIATAILFLFDIFINKKFLKHYKFILILIPLTVTILLFIYGYLTRGMYVRSIDEGLAGRLLFSGFVMNDLDIYKFFFGNKLDMTKVVLDVSTFAIFATRGIVMLVVMFICYIKYILAINSNYYKYLPAIASLIVAGITLPMLAWFSINMVIFLCLLEHTRKINYEFNYNHSSRL